MQCGITSKLKQAIKIWILLVIINAGNFKINKEVEFYEII